MITPRAQAIDTGQVARWQSLMAALRPKPLRVLVVTDATMKHQERVVLSVFGRAPLAACDCWQAVFPERSTRPALPGLRYVDEAQALSGRYDRVVGFDANAATARAAARHRVVTWFIGKVREPSTAASRDAVARLPGPILTCTTHRSLDEGAELDAFFGKGGWAPRGGIDFPPNISVHLLPPPDPAIPFLVPGGGDRDYATVWRARRAIPGPVVVLGRTGVGLTAEGLDALEAMRRDAQFTVLDQQPPARYLRLLLDTRVVLFPVLGDARYDYTCVSDAVWYGRPVVTNRVRATSHLADRVLFFDGDEELGRVLADLQDPRRWDVVSRCAAARARATTDLYALAVRVCAAL